MRAVLVFLLLWVPLLGLADWSGEVGVQADGRVRGTVTLSGRVSVSYSRDALSLGGSIETPLSQPGLWRATLRGTLSIPPFRLNARLALDGEGVDYLGMGFGFAPDPWSLWDGELRVNTKINLSIRDPLGSPAFSCSGSVSLKYLVGDMWCEAGAQVNLCPLPISLGRKTLALGYISGNWWITTRSAFSDAWDRTSIELGHTGDPLGLAVQGEFTPTGYSRVTGTLSLNLEAVRANVRFGFTPEGPVGPGFSVRYRGGGWNLSLSVKFEPSLRLEASRLGLTYRF
ncbi:hypothetical protein ACVNPS_09005 [Candidatus Bipolaricaulota sp. J31]